MTLLLATPVMQSLRIVVRHFGAFLFFPLGLLDMSFMAPGSFDALLIVLTVAHKDLWWYYALMATAGSVCGTWPSFQLGRKGGEEAIEKKLGAARAKKIFAAFQRWGFWSMFIGAVAPPPMPASAFVLAAGAMKYPWRRFLLVWTVGRLLRFGLLSWITMRYGRHLFHWFSGYYRSATWILFVVGIAAGAVALWFYLRERRRRAVESPAQQHRAA
jgi:membrane protein YqaA with SNARE-associated domain